jgi:hypothetical protein
MQIQGIESYRKAFPEAEQRKLAYELALDIRKFEIEMYWKRAAYFWTLIAGAFVGYFALASTTSVSRPILQFLMSCIGLVLSCSWHLVNRGSKYWQRNWERHVDTLEDEFAGPLYKTTISVKQFRWWKPTDAYPFSVSKINQLTSLFVALVWLALSISSFPAGQLPAYVIAAGPWILAAFTLSFLFLLILYSRGGSQGKDREIDFYKSALVPPKGVEQADPFTPETRTDPRDALSP